MVKKNSQFQRPSVWLELIAKEQTTALQMTQYSKYHAILMSCLPIQWSSKVMPGELNRGVWQLYVAHNHEAFQLQFILPEISEQLAKRLPYPPKLKVNANPHLWKAFPVRKRPVAVRNSKTYSLEEAELIIHRFLNKKK